MVVITCSYESIPRRGKVRADVTLTNGPLHSVLQYAHVWVLALRFVNWVQWRLKSSVQFMLWLWYPLEETCRGVSMPTFQNRDLSLFPGEMFSSSGDSTLIQKMHGHRGATLTCLSAILALWCLFVGNCYFFAKPSDDRADTRLLINYELNAANSSKWIIYILFYPNHLFCFS